METDITSSRPVKAARGGTADSRIAHELRKRAQSLAAGARFPSLREQAASFRASPVTVHRALAQLAREGIVVARPGDGTYVAARPAEPGSIDSSWQLSVLGSAPDPLAGPMFEPPPGGHLVLGTGYPDVSLQPLALLAKAAR